MTGKERHVYSANGLFLGKFPNVDNLYVYIVHYSPHNLFCVQLGVWLGQRPAILSEKKLFLLACLKSRRRAMLSLDVAF